MPCFLQFIVLVVGHIGRVFRSGSGIPKIPMSLQLFFRPLCFALPKEANAPKRTTQFLFGAFGFRELFESTFSALTAFRFLWQTLQHVSDRCRCPCRRGRKPSVQRCQRVLISGGGALPKRVPTPRLAKCRRGG